MLTPARTVLVGLLVVGGVGSPGSPADDTLVLVDPKAYDALEAVRVFEANPDSRIEDYERLAAAGAFDGRGESLPAFMDRGGDCWLVLDVRNQADATDWVVWARGQVQVLDLQVADGRLRRPVHNGYKVPAPKRPLWAIGYAFPLHLRRGIDQRLAFRAYFPAHEGLILRVLPRERFAGSNLWLTLLVLGTIGGLFALAFYNLFIFASTRDPAHAWYAGYSLASVGIWGTTYSLNGLLVDSGEILLMSNGLFVVVAALLGARFTEVFLDLRRTAPRLRRVFLGCYVGLGLLLPTLAFAPQPLFKLATALVGAPTLLTMIFAAFHAIIVGNRRARFLVVGWTPFLFMAAFLTFQLAGLLPPLMSTKEILVALHGFEILSMAFALADRIRLLQQAKDSAQADALQQLNMRLEESERRRVAENHRAMAEEEARRQRSRARTDGLTGLLNRAAFVTDGEDVERRLEGTVRLDAIVAMIDIDGLKRLNDTRGHATGDEMLGCFARELTRAVRSGDPIYRLGGDEFAVVALGDGAVLARALGERIRQAIRRVQEDGFPEVDASVGFALYSEAGGSTRHVLELADHRMYEEKRTGRDDDDGDVAEDASEPH